jgi:hypothetical protein
VVMEEISAKIGALEEVIALMGYVFVKRDMVGKIAQLMVFLYVEAVLVHKFLKMMSRVVRPKVLVVHQ